jgi:hypothetical protein
VDGHQAGYTEGGLQLQRWWIDNGATQPARHAIGVTRDIETNFLVNWLWFGVGGVLTYGIMMARSRLLWFPLHPVGILMCVPFAMYSMWFSIFLGLAVQSAHHALWRRRYLSQNDTDLSRPGAGPHHHGRAMGHHRRLAGAHRPRAVAVLF